MRDLAYRILFALCLVLAQPLAALAQDSAADISQEVDDDKGFVTRFLEEKLSGAGRSVVIDGFQGTPLKEGPQAGLRVVNGWQNSGLPWSTKMNPAKMYRLDKH